MCKKGRITLSDLQPSLPPIDAGILNRNIMFDNQLYRFTQTQFFF